MYRNVCAPENYERVDKRVARRLFDEGTTLYLTPCRCAVTSMFTVKVGKDWWGVEEDRTFDSLVNEFEYYNCNAELGRYTMYFVEKGEN